jgi:VanZ family protein
MPLKLWRTAFCATAVAVLALSLMPTTLETPGTGWDKSNHLLAYALLAWLGLRAYAQRPWPVLLGLLAHGGLVEALQFLTPHRLAEWSDLLADVLGLLLGWVVVYAARRVRRDAPSPER